MKLIIQIPCYNEASTLAQTLEELPGTVEGVDRVEVLVIDDGSTDGTAERARALGVDHVVRHTANKGLAAAFQTGLNACLRLGADVIVNTDADNQYPGRFIPELIAPVVSGQADIVIADRQTHRIQHFSAVKKVLQRIGSATVRFASGTSVPDAPSGFRAFSREAALRLNILTAYTYTLETIIQAGKKNLTVVHVPITTNPKTRDSRLMRSSRQYVSRSAATILRIFTLYEPLRTFGYLSLPFFGVGLVLWLRYLALLLFTDPERGAHIQSVVVGAAALTIGFLVGLFGILAEIVATNRRLQEETLYYLKRVTFSRETEKPE